MIASRDEADPGHPLAMGERYAQAIPGARLIVEDPGQSPLAWQGGQLSKALLELATTDLHKSVAKCSVPSHGQSARRELA